MKTTVNRERGSEKPFLPPHVFSRSFSACLSVFMWCSEPLRMRGTIFTFKGYTLKHLTTSKSTRANSPTLHTNTQIYLRQRYSSCSFFTLFLHVRIHVLQYSRTCDAFIKPGPAEQRRKLINTNVFLLYDWTEW